MANPNSTGQQLSVIANPYANEEPMPAGATGTLFLLASGFGIGALVEPQRANGDAGAHRTAHAATSA